MDAALRLLLAGACLCVMAASAHYAYSLYRQHVTEAQRIDLIGDELLREAKAAEAKRTADMREKQEARKAKNLRRKNAELEKKRTLQEARDNAASVLKDAVINY